ncbi:hypothetical protein DOY81_009459, partial [Sarcophaga bullata]
PVKGKLANWILINNWVDAKINSIESAVFTESNTEQILEDFATIMVGEFEKAPFGVRRELQRQQPQLSLYVIGQQTSTTSNKNAKSGG